MYTLSTPRFSLAMCSIPEHISRDALTLQEERLASELTHTEVSIIRDSHGAPRLLGSNAPVSISHSGTLLCVVVSHDTRPLGVDVELNRRAARIERVLERISSPAEIEIYKSSPVHLWCLKEALYKAAGHPDIDWTVELTVPHSQTAPCTVRGLLYSAALMLETPEYTLAVIIRN